MTTPRQNFAELPRATQAGILSNDPTFQSFAAMRLGLKAKQANASAAAEYIRMLCDITSRRDLDNPKYADYAAKRFDELRTEFDAYRGRIAQQR